MVGHPEWTEDPKLLLDRTTLAPTIDEWVSERTVNDVLDLASALRIPNAPIANGANIATLPHFVERASFVKNPRDGATNPGPAFRLGSAWLRPPEPSPRLGQHAVTDLLPREARLGRDRSIRASALPFAGLRVLEMTSYWAGPLVGHAPGAVGSGGHPPRVGDAARRRPFGRWRAADRGPVLGARADFRRPEHQQEGSDARPPVGRRSGAAAPARGHAAMWWWRTARHGYWSSWDSTTRRSGPRDPTSSCCGCRVSGSTAPGATGRPSRS